MQWLRQYIDMLQCPFCKGDLCIISKNSEEALLCKKCKKVFEIKDGIPIILKDTP